MMPVQNPYSRYAVVGNPIHHSLSPKIHALFAQQTNQRIHYERIFAELDAFTPCIQGLIASSFHGVNVTRPFKFEALRMASNLTPRAQLAGAANTLRFESDANQNLQIFADNTDGVGLVRDITCNAGVCIEGARILLIGSGGAAAGVLGYLIEAKPCLIVVANRTLKKAQDLIANHSTLAQSCQVALKATDLQGCGQAYDVVINSSAASQDGLGIPVSSQVLKTGALAVDMTYGKAADPFIQWAKTHGAYGRDGLGMLVEQGAEAFYFWRNIRPNGLPVLEQVRQEIA